MSRRHLPHTAALAVTHALRWQAQAWVCSPGRRHVGGGAAASKEGGAEAAAPACPPPASAVEADARAPIAPRGHLDHRLAWAPGRQDTVDSKAAPKRSRLVGGGVGDTGHRLVWNSYAARLACAPPPGGGEEKPAGPATGRWQGDRCGHCRCPPRPSDAATAARPGRRRGSRRRRARDAREEVR